MKMKRNLVFCLIATMVCFAITSPLSATGRGEPKAKQPLTLTYFTAMQGRGGITNYNEILSYKELERKTGVHIDFQHVSEQNMAEGFKLMLASGKYADIINWRWMDLKESPDKFIKDGVIIPLNEYIDKYCPNYKKIFVDHPEWIKLALSPEGNHYAFKLINGADWMAVWFGPMIRKDWLDKYNLPIPETIEDWENALRTFKTKDANGNGKNDELPLVLGAYGDPLGSFKLGRVFIGAWGITLDFYQEKGTIKYGPLQPQFKEFLTVMNRWYKDGLIDPDYAVTTSDMLTEKMSKNLVGAITGGASGGVGKYSNLLESVIPGFKIRGTPEPVLMKGQKPQLGQQDPMIINVGAAISTQCSKKIDAAKWLDYAYSPEGSMIINFGVEGISYNMVNGYPKYTDVIMHPASGSVDEAQAKYCVTNIGGPWIWDARFWEQLVSLPQQMEAIKLWANTDGSKLLPDNLVLSEQDMARLATKETDISTYVSEMVNKLIMGIEPLSSYDTFVSKLKSMGVDELVKARQTAIDKYNKR
jgi:putative aldouronate transport system substrate-binding protein